MISLKELAKMAGVDVSTVSRALNDSDRVKPDTKELIKQLARKNTYIPDDRARTLTGKSTCTVGIIIPEFLNTFYAEIIEGIDSVLSRAGYTIIFGKSSFRTELELNYLDTFLRKRVDGIIACSASQEFLDCAKRQRRDIPLVLADTYTINEEFDNITIDNAYGVESVLEYLLQSGHRKIGFISDTIVSAERLKTYRMVLKRHGMPIQNDYIAEGKERNERGGYLRMKELLALRDPPTAVFAVTDNMAIGAIHAIKEAGLAIPADISVAGFDDIMVSSFLDIPLTTVIQPKFEIGRISAELMLKRANGTQTGSMEQVILKPELVVRESSGILRKYAENK